MTQTHHQARSTTSAERRSVVVPEKPALEGLEDEVVGAVEGRRRPTGSTAPARATRSTRSTPRRPTVIGQPARRARLLLHAHRPDRPLPADARQGRVLPDGLGRQRPADRAPGAELLRRAVRPDAAVRPRLHPAREARPQAPGAGRPTQLRRAVRAAGASRTRRSSRGCGARSGSRSTGPSTTRRSGRSRSGSARWRSCATSPGARPISPTHRPCGTSRSRRPWRRPSWRRATTPVITTGSPTTGRTATPVYVETTRPELIASAVSR